jgi:hypothetical protein
VTDPIVPDDLARSKSGRVPQWVLDEARGIKTEPVPFRAAPSTSAPKPPREGRGWRSLRVLLTIAIVAGVVAVGAQTGFGGSGLNAASSNGTAHKNRPPTALEESDHPLGTPQPVVLDSDAFRIKDTQDDDKTAVTWSPCRPIHYVVRPDHQPANGARMIADAFARLSAVTGFRFVDDGATTEGPTPHRKPYQKDRYGDRWAPVLVLWATPDEEPDFGVEFAGEASTQQVRSASGDYVYVTGEVDLDPAKIGQIGQRHGEAEARSILLHELGHLMGLAHVNDSGEVMYPSPRAGITEFQPGDLAGLHTLATGPCQKDI